MIGAEAILRIASTVKDSKLVEQRREQIVDVACRLFARRGYHRTTMKEIADACGLAFGSVYSYFQSKEDVLYMVFEHVLRRKLAGVQAIARIDADPEAHLREVLRFAAGAAYENQNEIQLLYRENATLRGSARDYLSEIFAVEREYVALVKGIVDRGMASGVFRRVDSHLVANLVPLMLAIWPLKRWNLKGYTSDQVTEDVVEVFVRGIKAE